MIITAKNADILLCSGMLRLAYDIFFSMQSKVGQFQIRTIECRNLLEIFILLEV